MKKMKRKILVTHWDKNIDPEIFTIKGKSEKSMIIDFYQTSESIMYALEDGEEDEYLNEVASGELTKKELKQKCPFETVDDLIQYLNDVSDYHYRDK